MTPRPYRLGLRQAAVDETRTRILTAARALLAAEPGVGAFTIDTVAQQAGVARMTVYYQFASKRGLLEALENDLARRGLVGPLRAAFARSDPLEALDAFGAAFCGFWTSDRVVIRRLRSLAALDPDIGLSIRARDERRREGLRVILGRFAKRYQFRGTMDDAVDVLTALTSFELFDALARGNRTTDNVVDIMTRLMRAQLAVRAPKAKGRER